MFLHIFTTDGICFLYYELASLKLGHNFIHLHSFGFIIHQLPRHSSLSNLRY